MLIDVNEVERQQLPDGHPLSFTYLPVLGDSRVGKSAVGSSLPSAPGKKLGSRGRPSPGPLQFSATHYGFAQANTTRVLFNTKMALVEVHVLSFTTKMAFANEKVGCPKLAC